MICPLASNLIYQLRLKKFLPMLPFGFKGYLSVDVPVSSAYFSARQFLSLSLPKTSSLRKVNLPSPWATQTPKTLPSIPFSMMDGDFSIFTVLHRHSNLSDLLWSRTIPGSPVTSIFLVVFSKDKLVGYFQNKSRFNCLPFSASPTQPKRLIN